MGRRRSYTPLRVYLNRQLVGRLIKELSGSIKFIYERDWLINPNAIPISLSIPLRPEAYLGYPVSAVFENLLPDSDVMRRFIAEQVGAAGTDAFNLLSVIGRDCVGALQFLPEDTDYPYTTDIQGLQLTSLDIENILKGLKRIPLGINKESEFRISLAGIQEKTALLKHEDTWVKPIGTTPTTHILKPQIGYLHNGLDLSDSIENEFYCLKLMNLYGLPANHASIEIFGDTKVLVIQRFDRLWKTENEIIRLPQEDLCQALSVPPTLKYQDQGGPGINDILHLLAGSDQPLTDQILFIKSQIIFWLIAATDGHAKNYSIFLGSQGKFKLTPFYDVLSIQPRIDSQQIDLKQMRLALSVGKSRHYKLSEIARRHFIQSGKENGLREDILEKTIDEIIELTPKIFDKIESFLPNNFPDSLHQSIKKGAFKRLSALK